MKTMILAAGIGERMRPLTDHTPKPLLRVGGTPLIEHHIRHLVRAGLTELVINVSHLADQIIRHCGDGSRWGATIIYSHEETPLETAGGIVKALPLLGDGAFLVVNGDVWIDYPLEQLADYRPGPGECAHLVLVDNPAHNPQGDFVLDSTGLVRERPSGVSGLTYAGLGVYTPAYFAGMEAIKAPLRPMLDAAIRRQCLTGEYHAGEWEDVGTPERLQALDVAARAWD